ncbi:hypothetical protein JIN85_06035 [Luteolibacter pohnpeiensis]|uniref:Uncharacterized protein n=1 Tax=Luteolibacter pohnpeiensis TaxID=454153 RepID=A0A934S2G3_9BACT|nr:hypothetical protein [Luteolibacter pohnpeiensis]MBK1881965.1 hypothetical protein [Luteolibacter pohnpeiensis]
MKIFALAWLAVTSIPGFTQQDDSILKSESPDHAFFTATWRIPESDYIWQPDLDDFSLVVFPWVGKNELGDLDFSHDFTGRLPSQLQWSTDSKSIVVTTISSGGHSPWHYKTYVFSVADKRLVDADDLIGLVV